MHIDELKAAWAGLEARTGAIETRERAARRAGGLARARAWLRVTGAGLAVQVLVGVVLALIGGSYWFDHWGQLHLVLAGMALHAFGILVIVLAGTQLVAWRTVDFAGPILDVQARVARLRLRRARAERVMLVAGMTLWAPVALMLLETVGIDVWRISPAYVWGNVAAGIAIAAALAGAMRRWPGVFEDLGVGGGLRRAEKALSAREETT